MRATLAVDEEPSGERRLGEAKRVVFVYDDEGVGPRSLEHTLHSLRQHLDQSLHEVRLIDSKRIKQQDDEATLPWTSEACLLVMPGGADRPYDRALRGAGNARIRAWVEAGGRYLGLCAGGYYGCARVEFEKGSPAATGLEVCEDRELAFYAGTACGPLVPPGQFDYASERGSRAARLDATQLDPALAAVPVYYNGGCCFAGGGGGADQAWLALAHYNGLSLDDDDGDGGGGDVAKPVAIVSCAVGQGKAVLCGVHPEHDAHLLRAAYADDPHLARLLPALERGEPQRQLLFRSLLAHLGLHLGPPPPPGHCPERAQD